MDHIGMDVHKRESHIYILAERGEIIERRIRTEGERFAGVLGPRPRARILIEASTDSEWVALVQTRTRSISLLRALLRQHGYRVPSGSAEGFSQRGQGLPLPGRVRSVVAPLLAVLRPLNQPLAYSDATIERLAVHDPRIPRLRSVPCVGPVTAAAFVAVVDDVGRFHHAHQLDASLLPSILRRRPLPALCDKAGPEEGPSGEARRVVDSRLMEMRLAAACLMGWAATTNYTNHAAVMPLLMADLGFGPVQAGLLSTAFFVTLAIACVPAGMLSDRLGPTGVGTAGLVAVFASNLALGYARHFPDLLLIKVVGGLGCGLAFIAGMRYAALVVPPARVHRALGLYGGFVQLGGGTSLYLIPLLASFVGWRLAFIVSSGLIALSSVAWLALATRVRPSLGAAPLTEAVRSPKVWALGLVHTATFGLAVLVGIWITTFLVHEFGLSLVSAGAAGSTILALGVLSRPLGGLLVDRGVLGARAVMKLTVLTGAVGLLVLAWPGRPLVVAAATIVALGVAFNAPYAAVMHTTGVILPRAPGAAVGLVSGVGVLGISVGAPAVGALFASTGGFSLPFGSLAVFSLLVFWALFSL